MGPQLAGSDICHVFIVTFVTNDYFTPKKGVGGGLNKLCNMVGQGGSGQREPELLAACC
jgi:hypothetical protein